MNTTPLRTSAILLALLVLPAAARANAILDLYGTGLNAGGGLAADASVDPHYAIISGPAFVAGETPVSYPNAYVVTSPFPTWAPNQPGSQWISPTSDPTQYPTTNAPYGVTPYDYRTTFTLTAGEIPGTALISGTWAMDNSSSAILLNGVPTGITKNANDTGFLQLTPFTLFNGMGPNNATFVTGVNTLDFLVYNEGLPTGLQVNLTGTVSTVATPEPAALSLFLLGGLGLLARRRR